jgi:hypothetical protein
MTTMARPSLHRTAHLAAVGRRGIALAEDVTGTVFLVAIALFVVLLVLPAILTAAAPTPGA